MLQEAKYTGRQNGTKRTWTETGKDKFNEYMINVCRDRLARGKSFHQKLLDFWKKRYRRSVQTPKDGEVPERVRKRVKAHCDSTIYDLVKKSDPLLLEGQEEQWVDEDKNFEDVMEENIVYI